MKPTLVILASSSPRRASLLKALGIPFRRVAPDVNETRRPGESVRRYVQRLAIEKALAVAKRRPHSWVIAGDTTVVLDESLLGKPRNEREARKMLRQLSGRSHRVLSGITLVRGDRDWIQSAISSTRVTFRPLSDDVIRWYVRTGEPLDKAGAYGVQEKGGMLIASIDGSYSNVVGFPLEKFYDLWEAAGLPLPA